MYFFDTYALVELVNKNKNYEKYRDFNLVTSILNIAELYYHFLSKYNRKTADYWVKKISFDTVDFGEIECIEAMRYRHSRKKSSLSFVDCLGYVLSLKNNLKFLTGDKEFEKETNVEFVRK